MKFPDFVPPTKIHYAGDRVAKLHLRRCTLSAEGAPDLVFDKDEITLGAMEDNDVVLGDETVSRYHCKIVQEDSGYVLVDLGSTNGTFINKVRVREGYLRPGCTIGVGQQELRFNAREEQVDIVPSSADRCDGLIGRNARMREIYAILEKIAPTNTTVVIEGETGTGKEVVAQAVHNLSARSKGPFVVFDCGAVPPNLIESELFGHEKGSFTGAMMTRQGLFELADGGTLFLDELGELPIDLQPKLLRVLEQREVRRVGGAKPSKVDVRIIAATNRDLEVEVREGRFRQDLFYRLSVVRLLLPALRERPDDIPLLVSHFLKTQRYNRTASGETRVRGVSQDALGKLTSYQWPGNVRELVNVVERAVSFSESETFQASDLPEHILHRSGGAPAATMSARPPVRMSTGGGAAPQGSPGTVDLSGGAAAAGAGDLAGSDLTFKDAKERWVSSFERDYILALLKRHSGNISHAAREADIDRKYFRKLMKKYDIEAADATDD